MPIIERMEHRLAGWKRIYLSKGEWDSFSRFVVYELGDSASIHFWHDVWCDDFSLKFVYSELFLLACFSDAFVADVHYRQGLIMK